MSPESSSGNVQLPLALSRGLGSQARKLFGPEEIGSIGVCPEQSLIIREEVWKCTVMVTSWERVADGSQEKYQVWVVRTGLCIGSDALN